LALPYLDELIEVAEIEEEFPKFAVLAAAAPIWWQRKAHGYESARLDHVTYGEQAYPQVPGDRWQREQPRKNLGGPRHVFWSLP
jgi:hypothetical protein